ncbi:putative Heat shock protein 70 family [Helianthus annuus]|nr:putative Heat shock protein 70 family [Helianthus annuus]
MSVVIPRNTSIPTFKKGSYYLSDNSTKVRIRVFQGESNNVKDNVLLGWFKLYGLTPGSDGTSDLEVCFNIDANGILIVSAQEISTGQRKSITINKT